MTGKSNLKMLHVDASFFKNGEETSVFKNIRIHVTGPKVIFKEHQDHIKKF